jgi:hypothetical protein
MCYSKNVSDNVFTHPASPYAGEGYLPFKGGGDIYNPTSNICVPCDGTWIAPLHDYGIIFFCLYIGPPMEPIRAHGHIGNHRGNTSNL